MSKGELMYAKFMSYLAGEKGASMVEYSLLVLLIAIVALVAVTVAGSELSETYSEIGSNLVDAGS